MGGRQQQVRRLGEHGRVEVDAGDEQAALVLAGVVDDVDHLLDAGAPRALPIASLTMCARRLQHGARCSSALSVVWNGLRAPDRVHQALALDELLVDVDLLVAGIRRARVALLVAAHAARHRCRAGRRCCVASTSSTSADWIR